MQNFVARSPWVDDDTFRKYYAFVGRPRGGLDYGHRWKWCEGSIQYIVFFTSATLRFLLHRHRYNRIVSLCVSAGWILWSRNGDSSVPQPVTAMTDIHIARACRWCCRQVEHRNKCCDTSEGSSPVAVESFSLCFFLIELMKRKCRWTCICFFYFLIARRSERISRRCWVIGVVDTRVSMYGNRGGGEEAPVSALRIYILVN